MWPWRDGSALPDGYGRANDRLYSYPIIAIKNGLKFFLCVLGVSAVNSFLDKSAIRYC